MHGFRTYVAHASSTQTAALQTSNCNLKKKNDRDSVRGLSKGNLYPVHSILVYKTYVTYIS
jgi:hypothetical protein